MSKKKKIEPKRVPTKHQVSRWQRQMKIRRTIIIAAAVFLAGIASWVGYGYYKDEVVPGQEIAISVNDRSFDMNYFKETLKAYSTGIEANQLSAMIEVVADNLISGELIRQKGRDLGITATSEEIDEKLKEGKLPDNEAYRDIINASLVQEKLTEYFDSQVPDNMEQAHVQVMFVESQEVADEVIADIEAGGNFTALIEEFSCNPRTEGDLGWLPEEMMPNTLIAEAVSSLEPGEVSKPIYDESITKDLGYWLIEVTDKKDEEIKARALLLGSETEAEQVKAELSELFSDEFFLLAQKSQHESRYEDGELGWLSKGDMQSEAFDTVAFSIALDEVSDPVRDESVQTDGGYWIIQVLDKGEHKVADNIRTGLRDKLFNDWFEEQEKNSTLENWLDEEKKSWVISKILQGK